MDNGSAPRLDAGRRRTTGARRGTHRGRGAGRHRAGTGLELPGLPANLNKIHFTVAAAVAVVIAVGLAIGTEFFPGDEPGAGDEDHAPLLYSSGEAVPEDFAERHAGLVEQITAELASRFGITPDGLYDAESNPDGARVVLTIDRHLQEVAEASGTTTGVAAVEPGTGAVLCYYDAAASHPPASVFDMVTAAAAIENGAAPDSKWNDGDEEVTLTDAVRESRQDAIGEVAEDQGTQTILDTAAALGLSEMTDGFGVVQDFGQGIDYSAFDTAAFGRYPVSVIDMAAVYATVAADGLRADTHFIERVLVGDDLVQADQGIRTTQAVTTDTAGELQAIGLGHGDAIEGRDFFGLSGAWPDEPPQSWYVGAIPQLSVAAWIGDAGSAGDADTAGMPVWRQVVDTAIDVMDYEAESWDGGSGGGESPSGEEPPTEEPPSEEPSEEEPSSAEPTTQEPPDEPSDPPADPTSEEPPPDDPPDEPSEDPTTDDCWFVC